MSSNEYLAQIKLCLNVHFHELCWLLTLDIVFPVDAVIHIQHHRNLDIADVGAPCAGNDRTDLSTITDFDM